MDDNDTDLTTGRYLGDGVYASWDGVHIILELRAQVAVPGEAPRIALGSKVWRSLLQFELDLLNYLAALDLDEEK